MAADDHIRRTFDTLAERLRDEISRQLDEFSGPLAASLEGERADANTRLASALAEAADLRAALDDANNRIAEAVAETEDRVADAVASAQSRHTEAFAEAESRHTEAFAEAESRHAEAFAEADARHAVALAEAETRLAEAVAGAEDRLAEALARTDGRRADAVASERLVAALRAMDRARSLSEILDTLADCAGREAARVSVLLVRGSQLRAWRFIGFGPKLDEATQYDIPIPDAGIISDAVRSGAPVSRDDVSSGAHPSAPFFAELPPGRNAVALPMSMSGQVVAVLYADQGPVDDADITDVAAPAIPSWPASLEVMSRHAARCLEAITAYRSAQVQIKALHDAPRPDDAPSAATAAAPAADASFSPGSTGAPVDDEQAARRYARLLISEIKLYHEADVVVGRRERDLASRLGGEIARARVLYEQRVPAHIRQSMDCFHDELVRTLADGDRELIA